MLPPAALRRPLRRRQWCRISGDNMAYELSAVLGERKLLETLTRDDGVLVVALCQGFGAA